MSMWPGNEANVLRMQHHAYSWFDYFYTMCGYSLANLYSYTTHEHPPSQTSELG